MTDTVSAGPSAPAAPARKVGGVASAASVLLAILLVDLAVETLRAGSPLAWTVTGVAVFTLVLLALLWAKTGPSTRLAIPLVGLLGITAWVCLRLGSGAEPALRIGSIGLPRISVGLAMLATLAAVGLVFGLGFVRRAWYVGAVVALVAGHALVPLVRGAVASVPLVQVFSGTLDWPWLPPWLHGGFVATQAVLPLGLLAGISGVVVSLARRTRAPWTAPALLIVGAAFVVQSAELTRAGRNTVTGVVVSPLLPAVASVPSVNGAASAQAAVPASLPSNAVPAVGSPSGQAPTTPVPVAPLSQAAAIPLPEGAVAVAQPAQPIANKAVEVRVTGSRAAATIGAASAAAGREFLVIDMAWTNLLPQQKVNRKKATDRSAGAGSLGFGGGATARDKAQDEANTTLESVKFEVGPLTRHLWLVADGRFAEPLHVAATNALPGHLGPDRISIASFRQTISGPVAFEAPAGAQAVSILFLDAINGHVLLPITGAPPLLAASLGGAGVANQLVDLAITSASWTSAAAAAAGTRTFLVALRGISRQNAIVDVPFGEFGFLQTDRGCLVEPNPKAPGLTRQLAPLGRFLPFVPTEGQLAFEVPAGSNPIAFLLRLQQGGPIDMPFTAGARPGWPAPEVSITDGDVLKVLKLPGTPVPAGIPAAPAGRERVAVDLVVENLRAGAGIDLQRDQQFRLVTPDGVRHQPSRDSAKAPCSLGGAVVPAGASRRFTLVYDVPPGQPLQLEYRGFKVKSELVKVR